MALVKGGEVAPNVPYPAVSPDGKLGSLLPIAMLRATNPTPKRIGEHRLTVGPSWSGISPV